MSEEVEMAIDRVRELYAKSGGKAWEPPDRNHPLIVRLIERGYLRRCVMRCGFEAFDSGVNWTDAGHAALTRAGAKQ
jgi:hypothetical protein